MPLKLLLLKDDTVMALMDFVPGKAVFYNSIKTLGR